MRKGTPVREFKIALRKGELVVFRGRAYPKAKMEAAQRQVKQEMDRTMRKAERILKRRRGPMKKGEAKKKYTMVPTGA